MAGQEPARFFPRRLLQLVLFLVLVGLPRVAAAQVSWSGAYAGFDAGVGFKTLQFAVTDGFFAPSTFTGGPVNPGVNLGGHAGFDFRLKKSVSFGGEVGVQHLGYDGSMSYGAKNDTTATTQGGPAFTVMGRVGWTYRQVMPYFGAGALISKNSASIVDNCNTGGCASELGEGSGSTTATHWLLAYGMQFASTMRIAGRGWAVRIDWLQIEPTSIENVFARSVTGPLEPPGGRTVTSIVSTPLSSGTLRVMFDYRLTK